MIFANLEIICEKTTHFCIFFAQCAIKERNEQGPNVALLIIIFSIFYWWGKSLVSHHVESHAHSVEALAQVAHGLEGAVASEGGDSLKHIEQLLRFHSD